MRKITLLFALVAIMLFPSTLFSAEVPVYFVNENFDNGLLPASWTFVRSPYGNTASTNPTVLNNMLQFSSASATANRGTGINIPNSGSEKIVYLDFDWQIGSPITNYRNAALLMFHDNTTPAAPKDILGLYLGPWGEANVLHCWNMKIADTAAFIGSMETYPSFNRANTLDATNNGTIITNRVTNIGNGGTLFSLNLTYNIKATLNFETHQIEYLKVTKLSDNTFVEKTNLPFINSTASTVGEISFTTTRSSNAGNGGNSGWTTQIDNLKIYKLIEASVANVTINYQDANGNTVKESRIQSEVGVGTVYVATDLDKASFSSEGFYYAYDPISTDNVVAAEGGSSITLKFKKTALTAGTYAWNGGTNSTWNNFEDNFTVSGITGNTGYQNNNPVDFPASASNKTVNLTAELELGSNNINLAGDGYSLAGSGKLTGTGALNLNLGNGESATLNITNGLTGGVVVNGGTAIIAKDGAATKLTVANGATLNLSTGGAFSKAIEGTAGSTVTIVPTSNVIYTSAITGVDAVNYSLVSAGTVNTSGAYSTLPTLNNTFNGIINVSTTLTVNTMFGSTNNFTNNKLHLGDNVSLVYPVNPATGGTTIAIGELSGTSLSKLMGNRIARAMTYTIGELNTNSTFAGAIENYDLDNWNGAPVTNITKVGTGVLTLSGNSVNYRTGTVTVSNGSLEVTGTLGASTINVSVAANATLKGTGTIGGATTVNGILEGKLNFGSTLALAGTTNLTVNGFGEGECDVVNVVGALTNGGTLHVTVNGAAPANNTSIQLLKAGSYIGAFTQKNLPANYSFNDATGTLTYSTTATGLETPGTLQVNVYPVLTRGTLHISGNGVERVQVCSLAGHLVMSVVKPGDSSVLNIADLASGAYLVKVTLNDGSSKVQKVLLNK